MRTASSFPIRTFAVAVTDLKELLYCVLAADVGPIHVNKTHRM